MSTVSHTVHRAVAITLTNINTLLTRTMSFPNSAIIYVLAHPRAMQPNIWTTNPSETIITTYKKNMEISDSDISKDYISHR